MKIGFSNCNYNYNSDSNCSVRTVLIKEAVDIAIAKTAKKQKYQINETKY